ncbi:CRISPR-associated protein Cas1 [Desulfotomaculum nigrificans CO-1-SRB]|uniref:CRISPR-associated endonuclease Cas1 n=1 Tax=Desulfotomaculum nigrificans (strain DSM 14880 / VKM B-2319 / CO-1-SRB) TaxID=868595 RepID=F6B7Q9_DESCC|nr:type I-C CRISPR-associated endonuclease Cas1c [Desulfotomaculum nigrificans]AEF93431.1 CRISPR-associated protein Cas1 [Desulfotomaculum nigrificans CO-1-SRB]
MRKLLNTLYVMTPDAYLAKEGENVLIRVQEEVKFRIPVHNLEGIVCFGYIGASPAVMALCAERNVALSFLTENGHFLARVTGPVSGNVLLRRKQYRMSDDPVECSKLACAFILGKTANCRTVLQRALRDHSETIQREQVEKAVVSLGTRIEKISRCNSLEILRGLEGEAARIYFSVFDHLILAQKDAFYFCERNRRPPLDNMNALLSFLYTLLMHDVQSALETVGLDPAVGFLHRDRPGRPGLALDLMEELRPFLADRLALSLINRKQIDAKGFIEKESGGIIMKEETRKIVLTAWQKRKQEEIKHPFLNEKIAVGLVPYAQALLLARYLRGDLDGYPVFFWK